jgi:hypothetical protein
MARRLTDRESVIVALESRGGEESLGSPPGQRGRPSSAAASSPAAGPSRVSEVGREIWKSALRQAEFYAAYAETLENRRRPRRSRGRRDNRAADANAPGQWIRGATLATSYRRAAQHAALVDPRWATRLAVRAGTAYLAAGLPFGLYLLTGLLDDQTLSQSIPDHDLAARFQTRAMPDAVNHPVQLTYLLLAAASRPRLRDPLGRALDGAERRLAPHGSLPMGPQGVPLGDYLDVASAMRYGDDIVRPAGADRPAGGLAYRLAGLLRLRAVTLRAAQRNRYLWERGASPVSIVDLDHVALSGLALRHRPWFNELSAAIISELDRDDELAELPVWTMSTIQEALPKISRSVSVIVREPDRAWRSEDFRDPDPPAEPWAEEPGSRVPGTWSGAQTGPDYPLQREETGKPPYTRPIDRNFGDDGNDWDDGDGGGDSPPHRGR